MVTQAQVIEQKWVNSFVGQDSLRAGGADVDANGHVIVTGFNTNFASLNDIATVKYTSAGGQLWAVTYNGTGNGNDEGIGVATDNSGNYYVAGNSLGLTSVDIVVLKYSTLGLLLWEQRYDNGGLDNVIGIKRDVNGDFVVVGNSNGLGNDIVAIKYDENGNQLWAERFDFTTTERASSFDLDANGSIVITGNSGGGDILVLKLNSAGVQQWVQFYDRAGFNDQGNSVKFDATGNVFITGVANAGNNDIVVLKYDNNGILLWERLVEGYGNNDSGISLDTDGSNVFVTGVLISGSAGFIHTLSYDQNGNKKWSNTFYGSGTGINQPSKIVVNGQSCYITGIVSTGSGTNYLTLAYDLNSGVEKWKMVYQGNSGGRSRPNDITYDGTAVYVTGQENVVGGFVMTTVKYDDAMVFIPPDFHGEGPNPAYAFFTNKGQLTDVNGNTRPEIAYLTTRLAPRTLFSRDTVFTVYQKADSVENSIDTLHRVSMIWTGQNALSSEPFAVEPISTYHNYYYEHIPEGRTQVNAYSRVIYHNIYEYVDLHVYSNKNGIKYYFVINPRGTGNGNNTPNITLQFDGQNQLFTGANGTLNITTSLGELEFRRPVAYQYNPNSQSIIPLGWSPQYAVNGGGNQVGFSNVLGYNPNFPLIIMMERSQRGASGVNIPGFMDWSSYLGGSTFGFERMLDVGIGRNGNPHFTGYTNRDLFPVTNGVSNTILGSTDGTLTKIASNDLSIVWATYYGGTGIDLPYGIDMIDPTGSEEPIICGHTTSNNLPVTNGVFLCNGVNPSCDQVFVTRFDNTGILTWGTYYGEDDGERAWDIAVDNVNRKAVVVGESASNSPVTNPAGQPYFNTGNGLILKIDLASNTIELAGKFGGPTNDIIWGVDVDETTGEYYITGQTKGGIDFGGSPSLNTDPAFPQSAAYSGSFEPDAFVAKFDASDNVLYYMYYGASNSEDIGYKIVCGNNNNVYVTGTAKLNGHFTKQQAGGYIQSAINTTFSPFDAFILNLSHNGSPSSNVSVDWATYFGGTGAESNDPSPSADFNSPGYFMDIDVDNLGNIYVVGRSSNAAFSTTDGLPFPPAPPLNAFLQDEYQQIGPPSDGWIAAFDANTNHIWTTYFGGSNTDQMHGVKYDNTNGYLYICGTTKTINSVFPTPPNEFPVWDFDQNSFDDHFDGFGSIDDMGFVARFDVSNINTPDLSNVFENTVSPLMVFPNPTNNLLYYSIINLPFDGVEIQILDIAGRQVMLQSEATNSGVLNVQHLHTGVYHFLVKANNQVYTVKFLKL